MDAKRDPKIDNFEASGQIFEIVDLYIYIYTHTLNFKCFDISKIQNKYVHILRNYTEFHRNTQNNRLYYETHPQLQLTFSKVTILKINFFKKETFEKLKVLC